MKKSDTEPKFIGVSITKIETVKNGLSHPDDDIIIEIVETQGDSRKSIKIAQIQAKTLKRVVSVALTTAAASSLSWIGHYMGLY